MKKRSTSAVRVNADTAAKARKLQKEFKRKGVVLTLFECCKMVEDGNTHFNDFDNFDVFKGFKL